MAAPTLLLNTLRDRFNDQIARQISELPDLAEGPVTVRVECDRVDLLDWLESIDCDIKMYWRSRRSDFEIAGCGEAFAIRETDPERIPEALAAATNLANREANGTQCRLIGGLAFDPTAATGSPWDDFPSFWLLLPEICLTREEETHFFSVSAMAQSGWTPERLRARLLKSFDSLVTLPASDLVKAIPEILRRQHTPDHDNWVRIIGDCQAVMPDESVDKVVLARRSDLELSGELSAFDYLRRLRQMHSDCTAFLVQPQPGRAFVGVTPERLFKIEGAMLLTEAIAGTAERGSDRSDDAERQHNLESSLKESREHRFVVDAVAAALRQFCDDVNVAARPEILKLARVQHLKTTASGRLGEATGLADIVDSLHPTPAVGGTPREKALALIRRFETFARGWYAGLVGHVGPDETEFAVAIRSAMIAGSRISLYAGAGIVAESQPALEWRELDAKIAAPLSLFAERQA